jgi:hypothetical protein
MERKPFVFEVVVMYTREEIKLKFTIEQATKAQRGEGG